MQGIPPGQDQQPLGDKQMPVYQTGGIQGIMGQRLPYDPNATNDLSDMAVRLMQRHGETTPEEREQQEAEARLQKELEEAERLKEAEINSHAEKPWEWMRDHDKEHREGDFLVALSSRAEHLEVVRAGRKWRQVSMHACWSDHASSTSYESFNCLTAFRPYKTTPPFPQQCIILT